MKRKHLIIISTTLIACTALYAIAGFYLAPALLKSTIQDHVAETTGRTLRIDNIAINPFTLEVEVSGLDLRDRDDTVLLGMESLYGNFNGPALLTGTVEIAETGIERPRTELVLLDDKQSNLARFLSDLLGEGSGDGGLIPLRIVRLAVSGGAFDLSNTATDPASGISFTNITLNASELTTEAGSPGLFDLYLEIPRGGSISVEGNISPLGLTSRGQLVARDLKLAVIGERLPKVSGIKDIAALVNINSAYEASFTDGHINLELTGTELGLSRLRLDLAQELGSLGVDNIAVQLTANVSGNADGLQTVLALSELRLSSAEFAMVDQDTPLLALDELVLAGGKLDLAAREFRLARLAVNGGKLWLDQAAGGLERLVPARPTETDSSASQVPEWELSVDRIETRAIDLGVSTVLNEIPASIELNVISLDILDIGTGIDKTSDFKLSARTGSSGTLQASGWLAIMRPAIKAAIDLQAFDLLTLNPVLQAFTGLKLEDGLFNTEIDLGYEEGNAELSGTFAANSIELLDRSSGERIMAMAGLQGTGLHLGDSMSSLTLDKMALDKPYMNVIINADRSINLAALLNTGAPEKKAGDSPADLPRLRIEQVEINHGRLDFSDLSLSPNFKVTSQDMNGTVRGLHLQADRSALLELEGRIDEYGSSAITGRLQPLDPLQQSEISMDLRNISTSIMSPYAARFAGRKIESGKLNLKLDYVISNGEVDGSNNIELVDFVLGERIESPDAVDLPLDLAIALFRDGDGRINLAIPVTGNLENPEFDVRAVIARALQQVLVKAAAAPFKLLGSLLGGDAPDKLDAVPFEPGATEITPPAREVITAVGDILNKRPMLALVSVGTYDPVADRDALARQQVRLHLSLATVEDPAQAGKPKPVNFSDPLVQDVLDEFGKSRLGEDVITDIGGRYSTGDEDTAQDTARRAYYQALFDALVQNEEVSEFAIKNLARYRAQSIVDELQRHGIQSGRLRVADALETNDSVNDRIAVKLEMQTTE